MLVMMLLKEGKEMIDEISSEKKKILFVDDQWCIEDKQCILRSDYGQLRREGYDFLYETAFDESRGRYITEKVVQRVVQDSPSIVILDMDFCKDPFDTRNFKSQTGFGRTILARLMQEDSELPVVIHSSSNDKALKADCLRIGAREWLEKKATYEELKRVVEDHGRFR